MPFLNQLMETSQTGLVLMILNATRINLEIGSSQKYKTCINPAPLYGGDPCPNAANETIPCNPGTYNRFRMCHFHFLYL